jgi:hypothetical protein
MYFLCVLARHFKGIPSSSYAMLMVTDCAALGEGSTNHLMCYHDTGRKLKCH